MRLISNYTQLNNAGDTIVEVLIAVAVVSLVLTASFAIVNESSRGIRSAQEREEATKLTSALVESLEGDSTLYPRTSTSPLCIDGSQAHLGASSLPALSADATTWYDNPLNNSKCLTTNGITYATSIYSDGLTPATYTIDTRWDGLDGNRNQVQFNYRLAQ